jgi:hypothetical protein
MLELIKIKKDIAWILEQIKCLFAKGTYATAWSSDHTLLTGGPYLKDTIVWYQGSIYKAKHNNESELPTNIIYWECIGEGFLLEEKIPDWWALPGTKTYIKNKPTKTSNFLNDGELGVSPYVTEQFVYDVLDTLNGGTDSTFDKNYIHNQLSASNTWNVTHNLNKYASVTVVDSGNSVVVGEVQYINSNQITIIFQASFSGKAYIN